ncbi:hypothetical protein M408DRAFT_179239 [Serendipita vermifera MAFF 305830]|uniref:Uncharacterized protein n=1 Tax=Serendipita vermifera MAFF 305830 TaxID=933852 RepID=A0A0C3B5F1_SERVB|nr:hypothetical protein M408DRAFT_179239 [Serendipita vermifera MAFF 305830]
MDFRLRYDDSAQLPLRGRACRTSINHTHSLLRSVCLSRHSIHSWISGEIETQLIEEQRKAFVVWFSMNKSGTGAYMESMVTLAGARLPFRQLSQKQLRYSPPTSLSHSFFKIKT